MNMTLFLVCSVNAMLGELGAIKALQFLREEIYPQINLRYLHLFLEFRVCDPSKEGEARFLL